MNIKELNEAIGRALNEISDAPVNAVADKRKDAFEKNRADFYIGNGFFKAGSDGVQIGDAFQCTYAGHRVTVANIPTDGIITQDLYFYKTGGDYSGLSEIFITAYTLQEITEEQYTPSSYSFIIETEGIKLVKEDTLYFAVKSYEKGQYYGN